MVKEKMYKSHVYQVVERKSIQEAHISSSLSFSSLSVAY